MPAATLYQWQQTPWLTELVTFKYWITLQYMYGNFKIKDKRTLFQTLLKVNNISFNILFFM